MNIHEIIHAWENNALPDNLPALAAMESKVDEYAAVAFSAGERAKTVAVIAHYSGQVQLFSQISESIQRKIEDVLDSCYAEGGVPA